MRQLYLRTLPRPGVTFRDVTKGTRRARSARRAPSTGQSRLARSISETPGSDFTGRYRSAAMIAVRPALTTGEQVVQVAAGRLLPPPGRDRPEQHVPTPQRLDLEAGFLHDLGQGLPGVPTDVADRVVVLGPELHVARHRDQQGAAGTQHPGDLGRGEVVLFDVFEHVERRDQIHRVGLHRQVPGVGADDVQPTLLGHLGALGGVLHGQRLPTTCAQHPGVAAAGRADVQRPAGVAQPSELAVEEDSTLLVPPMLVFQCGELAHLSRFHGGHDRAPARSSANRRVPMSAVSHCQVGASERPANPATLGHRCGLNKVNMRLPPTILRNSTGGEINPIRRSRRSPKGSEMSQTGAPTLSVVIPMYNEEACCPLLVERLRPVLDGIGEPYEVVAVDDGSHDATPQLLIGLRRVWPELRVVRLRRNSGHQAALTAGPAPGRRRVRGEHRRRPAGPTRDHRRDAGRWPAGTAWTSSTASGSTAAPTRSSSAGPPGSTTG